MLTRRPGLVVAIMLFGATAYAPAAQAGSRTYDVPGTYTYVVPATVTSLTVAAIGGNGKDAMSAPGGKGRVVTANLVVTPGDVLQITVAGSGAGDGFGGGGGVRGGFGPPSLGGGASDIRVPPFSAADRVVVAGGGGGGAFLGGAGGNAGSNGSNSGGMTPGIGGTAGAAGVGGVGGAPADACCSGGTNGTATNGGNEGSGNFNGGGGGGGYGGGGGGGGGQSCCGGGGGAGGGSLGTPTGFNASVSGNGSVTVTHAATTIEVLNTLSPTSDPGRFDLRINGTTFKTDAANGGTTQQQVVPASNTVAVANGTGTNVVDYVSALACSNGQSATGIGPANVAVAAGESVLCTFTNTRGTGTLTVVKDLEPSSDTGRFDLQIDGVTRHAAAGDGDSTGPVTVTTGSRTVGEVAVAGTDPARYTTTIECKSSGGTVVASGSDTGPLPVHVGSGDDVTCTIRDAVPPTLTVTTSVVPASDPGRFDLQIDGATKHAAAGDGDSTGPVTVTTGTRTVGESAVAPATAAQYATAIECRNGSGAVVASDSTAGPLAVPAAAGDQITCVITNTRKAELPKPADPVPPLRFRLAISHRTVRVKDGKVALAIRCRRSTGGRCQGTLTLLSAAGSRRARAAAVYGSARFDIAAGTDGRITIKAPGALRKKLAKRHKMIATVRVGLVQEAGAPTTLERRITLIG